jgi:hypothetical protein
MSAVDIADAATGKFVAGNPGYRLRVRAKDEIRRQLLADYDFASPSHAMQLESIVTNIYDSTHARNRVDRTRAGNLYKRQLRDIPRKQPPTPSRKYRELYPIESTAKHD